MTTHIAEKSKVGRPRGRSPLYQEALTVPIGGTMKVPRQRSGVASRIKKSLGLVFTERADGEYIILTRLPSAKDLV